MRYAIFAQATLQALVDLGGTANKQDVLRRIRELVPPNDHERAKLKSGPVRWEVAVVWSTTNFRAAGWLEKSGEGTWVISDDGREALETLDAHELRTTAARLYRENKLKKPQGEHGSEIEDGDGDPPDATILSADTDLIDATSFPEPILNEYLEILRTRRQLVLYGPPGTGKTFVASALASHCVGKLKAAYTIVQFHPSYTYEDFFEGFRPVVRDGVASYELRPGPLRRIASDAENNPGQAYVLVVDEINRANIAKVFGELYYLLEYRDETIALQYRESEEFSLPRNVYIIATMNTVDRSIALVDAAIRRRFAFAELHPSEEPVLGLLDRSGRTEGARLLRALNSAIGENRRDLHVGPSYLMGPEAATPAGLSRIWRYDILPLLEEQFYGELTRVEVHRRFGLDAVNTVAASTN
jgi:5-methylcytosine-specific restriction protein B